MLLVAETLNSSSPSVLSALQAGDRAWLEAMARRLAEAGAHAVDCNASAVGSAESAVLNWMSEIVEASVDLPISIDSADPEILVRVGSRRRRAPILNSLPADPSLWRPELLALVSERGARLIVQLRRGSALPSGSEDRLRWTVEAVDQLSEKGIGPEMLLVDPVFLPWGDDLNAGRGVLEFMAALPMHCPDLQCIVPLSNVSWGHAQRRVLHQRWMQELQSLPVGGVICDPFDRDLVRLIRS